MSGPGASIATAGTGFTGENTFPTQPTGRWPFLQRVLLVWLALCAVLIAINWHQIVIGRFGDPDDALRLVQVRDLLAGQPWFDLHQYRVMAPQGVPMHWSRLVDIPLAGMILMLRPFIGNGAAEMTTLIAVPMLTLLCALLLVGRLAARLRDLELVSIAALVLAIASPVLFQMTPLRIDHHGWQIVLALAAMNGLCARDAWKGGLVVGMAMATLLSISIEGLPLTATLLGVCALRGLRDKEDRFTWLVAATTPLALGGIALFLGTRGMGDLVTHCDAVSPIHLAVFAWVGASAWTLRLIGPKPVPVQMAILAAIGAGALAIMLGGAPECRDGAFSALDPLVRKYWYAGIPEGLPVWRSPTAYASITIFVPLFGMLGCALRIRNAPDAQTRWLWIEYALVLLGAWGVALMVARAAATACAIAAVPTAAMVLDWITRLRTEPRVGRRLLGYLAVIPILTPSVAVGIWGKMQQKPTVHRTNVPMKFSQCRYNIAADALNRLPATDIFAPLDIGPDLLVRTHHRVIATGHHRASAGIHDVIAAFIAKPEQALPIIRAHHATLIVTCPDIAEPHIYAGDAPHGLMAALMDGKPPAWAEPVNMAPGSNMQFWRIKP